MIASGHQKTAPEITSEKHVGSTKLKLREIRHNLYYLPRSSGTPNHNTGNAANATGQLNQRGCRTCGHGCRRDGHWECPPSNRKYDGDPARCGSGVAACMVSTPVNAEVLSRCSLDSGCSLSDGGNMAAGGCVRMPFCTSPHPCQWANHYPENGARHVQMVA